jgi:hypothetical protein
MINTDPKTQEALDAIIKKVDIASLKTEDIIADAAAQLHMAGARLHVAAVLLKKKAEQISEPAPEQAQEESSEG